MDYSQTLYNQILEHVQDLRLYKRYNETLAIHILQYIIENLNYRELDCIIDFYFKQIFNSFLNNIIKDSYIRQVKHLMGRKFVELYLHNHRPDIHTTKFMYRILNALDKHEPDVVDALVWKLIRNMSPENIDKLTLFLPDKDIYELRSRISPHLRNYITYTKYPNV